MSPQLHRDHHYAARITWTGNTGSGTSGYRDYSRDHEVRVSSKSEPLLGSSDRTFHGNPGRWNPEELLLSALGQCHLLSYLHLCAVNAVVVLDYVDEAVGTMTTDADGSGRFTEVVLRPRVRISAGSDPERAAALHDDAHRLCFIANSVAFPVGHEPVIDVAAT